MVAHTEPVPINSSRARTAHARRARADRIMDVAADLLQRWGYKRVTIDDIAEEAAIGKGTIYLHWKTREALFASVMAREGLAMLDEVMEQLRHEPRTTLLPRLIHVYFRSIVRRPVLRAVLVSDVDMLGKMAQMQAELEAQQATLFSDYLRLLAEFGVIRRDLSAEDAFYLSQAIIIGFFLGEPFVNQPEAISLERRGELLEDALCRTFAVQEPSAEVLATFAPRVIELFSSMADLYQSQVRQAYE